MKMECALVEDCFMVFGRDKEASHLFAGQIAQVQPELTPLALASSLQGTARVVAQSLCDAGNELDIPDTEFVDGAADDVDAFHRQAEEFSRLIFSHAPLDR